MLIPRYCCALFRFSIRVDRKKGHVRTLLNFSSRSRGGDFEGQNCVINNPIEKVFFVSREKRGWVPNPLDPSMNFVEKNTYIWLWCCDIWAHESLHSRLFSMNVGQRSWSQIKHIIMYPKILWNVLQTSNNRTEYNNGPKGPHIVHLGTMCHFCCRIGYMAAILVFRSARKTQTWQRTWDHNSALDPSVLSSSSCVHV